MVTGAGGFLGQALVRELLLRGVEVIALARSENPVLDPSVRWIPFDLSRVDQVERVVHDRDIEVFFHLAWSGTSGVARAETCVQLDNVKASVDCLRLANRLGCGRFVGAGSIMEHEVFADLYRSGHRPDMGSIYGSAKLAAHGICRALSASLGIDFLWGEVTNAYGPGEQSVRLINSTLRKLAPGMRLEFSSGEQIYDFIYVEDVARAFCMIADSGNPFSTYKIGSLSPKKLRDYLLLIKEMFGKDCDFCFGSIPDRGSILDFSDFDCSATERDTGFRAVIPFEEGIRRTMDWIRSCG